MKRVILSLITIASISSNAIWAGDSNIKALPKPVPIPPVSTVKQQNFTPPLGMYIGGGFTYAKTECECKEISTSAKTVQGKSKGTTSGVNLKAGYEFNEFIALEGKYIHTPWGDEGKALKHYGLYLKPSYKVYDNISLYGLLGYGKTKCEYQNIDEKGFAWGLGGEYTIGQRDKTQNKTWGLYVEYNRPLNKSGNKEITTNIANAGVSYHF